MKKLLVLFLAMFATAAFAQEKKAPQSPTITSESANITVKYGQPSKRGRVIFGGLEQYGKVWRTGANAATEITFKKDVNFGGKPVKAGTYTLFSIPEEKEWTVILNSELKQFGAFGYEKIKDKNVAEVKVPVKKLSTPEEKLIIKSNDDKELIISWDDVLVSVPLKW
jgi:hypothetical protein